MIFYQASIKHTIFTQFRGKNGLKMCVFCAKLFNELRKTVKISPYRRQKADFPLTFCIGPENCVNLCILP